MNRPNVPFIFRDHQRWDTAGCHGQPLPGLTEGTATGWPDDVFLQISESQVGRAIRTKVLKYSVYAPHKDGNKDAASEHCGAVPLRLGARPHVRNNLVADPAYAEVRAELRERPIQRMAAAGESVPSIAPARLR